MRKRVMCFRFNIWKFDPSADVRIDFLTSCRTDSDRLAEPIKPPMGVTRFLVHGSIGDVLLHDVQRLSHLESDRSTA